MLIKITTLLLIATISTYAIQENKIKKEVETKVNKVLKILKNPSYSQTKKDMKSLNVMSSAFDYGTMAKISMGKNWVKLSPKQKKEFTRSFERKIKNSYIDKLKLYNNQKVIVKNIVKKNPTRITLETNIIGSDDTYKVTYLFYKKTRSDEWFVYDVNLVGVSIIQTYRKQFSEFLKTKTIKQLIASL